MSHSPDNTSRYIHDSAQGISRTYDFKTDDAFMYYQGICIVKAYENLSEKKNRISKYESYKKNSKKRYPRHFFYPGKILLSHILGNKSEGSLGKTVHRYINEAFDICSCRVSGNSNVSEGIYGTLYYDIGKGKNDSLKSGRKTDFYYLGHNGKIHSETAEIQMKFIIFLYETHNDKKSCNSLTYNSSKGNSRNTHPAYYDKKKIQDYIYYSGYKKKIQRTLCITFCP